VNFNYCQYTKYRRQKRVQNEKNHRKKITDGFNILRELIPFG
ncbi:13663_t:CDS:1, partial [Racocetra persica]